MNVNRKSKKTQVYFFIFIQYAQKLLPKIASFRQTEITKRKQKQNSRRRRFADGSSGSRTNALKGQVSS